MKYGRTLTLASLAVFGFISALAGDDIQPLGWSGKEFKISPNDTIYVKVLNHDEIGGKLQVMPNGFVSVAGVGTFEAAGENAGHLARSIRASLVPRMANPEVKTWIVWDNKVYIWGQVKHAGDHSITAGTSVKGVIEQAGGLTEMG